MWRATLLAFWARLGDFHLFGDEGDEEGFCFALLRLGEGETGLGFFFFFFSEAGEIKPEGRGEEEEEEEEAVVTARAARPHFVRGVGCGLACLEEVFEATFAGLAGLAGFAGLAVAAEVFATREGVLLP